ncbi:MAG: hypothetical protein JW939_03690, partial [Candidatus Thermoplasmatota archaeon]|nr:hypothetical protein [Candidatus Thermoplasmatota archaeon]
MPQEPRVSYQVRMWTVLVLTFLMAIPVAAIIAPISNSAEAEKPVAGPPTRAWLDIAIRDIDVKRPTQSNNLYPGQLVRIDVALVHDNNPQVSDIPISKANGNQFTCVLVVDDSYTNVTTRYAQVTSMGTNYTGDDIPGPNAQFPPFVVTFYWTVPLKPPAQSGGWSNFQFRVSSTITVDDDDKSDNFRSGSGIRISSPEFSPFIYEEGQEDRTYETKYPHPVKVGDVKFIPFQLQNRGPAVDIIGVKLISAPEGWNIESFSPITVYPNDFEELQLPVQVSKNPFNARCDRTYTVVMRAYSTLYAGPYLEPSDHTFKFIVDFMAKAELKPDTESVYLEPGKVHNVIFWLRNMGNGKDIYTLAEKIDDYHVKKGWKVGFESGTRQPEVHPDEYFEVKTWVSIPTDAPLLDNINLVLTIRSQNGDFTGLSESCTVFADIRYAARIESFEEPFPVIPGKENKIMFNFTNEGNAPDPDQHLNVSYRPKGWWIYIDQTKLKAQKGLGPKTTAYLEMVVYVDETTIASSKGSLPFIIIQARGGPHDHIEAEVRYYFLIPLTHKLELTTPVREKNGFVGGQVEFQINARNLGNYLDTFNISVNSDWAEFDVDLSEGEIAPNETYPVKLIVSIPFNAAADTNPDTPLPDLRGQYDGYTIRVSGYSQNETRKGATLVFLDLILHVQPFYNFEMRLHPDEPELKFSMDHDQARSVRVQITNTGNIADILRLDWVDNPYQGWLMLLTPNMDVPFDSSVNAVLNINPRAGTITEERNITMELKAVSLRDPDRMNPLTMTIPITIRFYRMMFDIGEVKLNGEVFEGVPQMVYDRMYSFHVNIENIGSEELNPTRFSRLYIVLYDEGYEMDRANITYLKLQEAKEVTFLWKAAPPGTHHFTIALEGEVPVSARGSLEKEFNVYVVPTNIPPPPPKEVPLWMFLLPLILIVIFAAAAFVFITKFNQIIISPIDTGYDESGEYRPWAVKEKLMGEPEQLGQPEETKALPPPQAPALPAAPESVAPTQTPPAPVRSGPLPAAQPMGATGPMPQARPVQGSASPRPAGAPVPMVQARPMAQPATAQPPRPQVPPQQMARPPTAQPGAQPPRPQVPPQQMARPPTAQPGAPPPRPQVPPQQMARPPTAQPGAQPPRPQVPSQQPARPPTAQPGAQPPRPQVPSQQPARPPTAQPGAQPPRPQV